MRLINQCGSFMNKAENLKKKNLKISGCGLYTGALNRPKFKIYIWEEIRMSTEKKRFVFQPRVMSSYFFGDNSDQGPPHNSDYTTADVPINSDGSCGGGWVCEHRWPSIGNMAAFRNAVAGTSVTNYQQQGDVVGFARGNKVRKKMYMVQMQREAIQSQCNFFSKYAENLRFRKRGTKRNFSWIAHTYEMHRCLQTYQARSPSSMQIRIYLLMYDAQKLIQCKRIRQPSNAVSFVHQEMRFRSKTFNRC